MNIILKYKISERTILDMKICSNCHFNYPEQYVVCPRCGSSSAYNNNGTGGSVYPPGVVVQKPKTFFFGEFLKMYFKSPLQSRSFLLSHKDFGSCLLLNGITLFVIFIYIICIQGGMAIRYGMGFSALITLLCPILFYIIMLGFQFLDVFLYALYIKGTRRKRIPNPAFNSYIRCSTSSIFSIMILLLSSFFGLASPIMGSLLLPVVISIGSFASMDGKVECGAKPETLLDYFMFILTGVLAFGIAALLIALFVYIAVSSGISSALFNYFEYFM